MGKIIHATLPVELAESIEPTVALYRNILRGVGIKPIFTLEKSAMPILIYPTQFEEALMLTIVSDTDESLECVLRFTETNSILRCTMHAQSSAVIFIDANREKVIDAMNVEVELGKG